MRGLFLSALLLSALTAFACLNETRTSARGKITEDDDFGYYPQGHNYNNISLYEENLHKFDSLWHANHDVNDYSDYGVNLVYLGRYEDAKNVFIEIEKLKPGRYATAANLGTVYELLGDNEHALLWIRKAVAIDPSSHFGSEWIHVKILEAKIGGDKLITTSFLLNTTFGEDDIPETDLSDDELEALRNALFYQLEERMSFVKPQDKIVGLLLFELGNIVSLTNDVNSAAAIYEEAGTYGYQSELMNRRINKFEKMSEALKHEIFPGRWLKYGFLFALMIAGIVIVVKLVATKNQETEK